MVGSVLNRNGTAGGSARGVAGWAVETWPCCVCRDYLGRASGGDEREHAVSCGLFACARLRVRMHRPHAQGAPATWPRKQDARWAAVNGWWSQRVNWLVTESERARTDRCSEEFVCLRYGLTLTSQHSGPLDGNPFLNPPQAGFVTASR